uniref:Uncharacterized protein n=1 Tax=Anguilla anguilla TaxID=7936 RepID=A0A0E9S250_ANGAN
MHKVNFHSYAEDTQFYLSVMAKLSKHHLYFNKLPH